jgi:bacillithiol biosynthesis deacetylase BshB1
VKLDILAIGVHPDDVELSCAGTLLKAIEQGKKVGILDLSHGELGTRGSGPLRLKEAAHSAEILGVGIRENLGFKDGFFQNDEVHQRAIAQIIRKYRPDIVLANAIDDRHPDHGRASKLISDACFYSGLRKVETIMEGEEQKAWRPKAVYHYIQDRFLQPDFVVDVTSHVATKMEAIKAFSSQFYDPNSKEPESPLTSENFLNFVKGRMMDMGRYIQVDYAEGYTVERPLGVEDLSDLY